MTTRRIFGDDRTLVAGIVLALLTVYALTAPRTVALEDDGLFIMAALDAGVAHPPGYPLFVLLGHLFSYLPLGSPAFRMHLLSGLFGALACGVLYLTGRRLQLPAWAAALAALGWGLSESYWSQAIIAEVYTLNALLCVATFYFCLGARAGDSRQLYAAALCFGLGLANHWPLVVLAGAGFLLLLAPYWQRLLSRLPGAVLLALASPIICYMWMILRSHDPVTAFYGPLENLQDVWFFLSRKGYAGVDVSAATGLADDLAFTGVFLRELLVCLTPAGAALACYGMVAVWRTARSVLLAALAIIGAHSLLLILLLGLDYEDLQVAVFRPYPITAYGFWALLMGYGAAALARRLRGSIHAGLLVWGGALCLMVIPVYLLLTNLRVNDRSADTFAGDYARVALASLPPDAVYFVNGDLEVGPLGYLRYAEGVRPDVALFSVQGLVFPNRLFSPRADKAGVQAAKLARYLADNPRPLFITSVADLPDALGAASVVDYGMYSRFTLESGQGLARAQPDETLIRYLHDIEPHSQSTDTWIRHTHGKLMHRAGRLVAYAELSEDPGLTADPGLQSLQALLHRHYHGLLGMVELLVEQGGEARLGLAQQRLEQALPLLQDGMEKERRARHYYLMGFVRYSQGHTAEAIQHFRHSVELYPAPDNASVQALDILRRGASG